MIRNKSFINFICAISIASALLVIITGRAIPVYALADPQIVPELAPVFDTEIIQLQDYIENNVAAPQFEIFNILLGLYVAGQGGFSEYKLHDPYANSSDILDWLKSCGIRLYNHLIGMGSIGVDPITGIDYRPYIKGAADIAMGCAVKSTQYTDVSDFVSDVNVQEKYFIPLDFGIQGALNYIFSKNGGLYEWQFEQSDFASTVNYKSVVLQPTSNYWTLLSSFSEPIVRLNDNASSNITNFVANSSFFSNYRNILLNTTDGYLYFYSDDGTFVNSEYLLNQEVRTLIHFTDSNTNSIWTSASFSFQTKYLYPTLDTYPEIVQWLIDNQWFSRSPYTSTFIYINDFIKHYYYGPNWQNKTEIFHNTNLNLDPNTLPYYQQITNDYLLDVKGILADLLNETDLTNVILNNIYDLDAIKVEDPKLIRVTTEILEEIQVLNPPLPVNLNDINLYTDNNYLTEIKERSTKFGETLGDYFVFWHNSDPMTVYVIFGSVIVILIGAFIGKWGHS